jgi:hypothetical protein
VARGESASGGGSFLKFIAHGSWFIVISWPDEKGIATIYHLGDPPA